MQNLFPVQGKPIGMPDFDAGIQYDTGGQNPFGININREGPIRYGPKPMVTEPEKFIQTVDRSITPTQKEAFRLQEKEIESRGDIARHGMGIKERDSAIRQQRADIYDFKAKNPHMKIIMPPGGNVSAINPLTGETMDLGISSGKMDEEDRLRLTGGQRMEQIGARGDIQRDIQGTRGQQRLGEIAASIAGRQQLQDTRPNKELAPTQLRTTQQNIARELVNTRPDLGKFITFDERGNPVNTAPQGSPEFDRINSALYKPGKDIKLPSEKKAEIKPTTTSDKIMVEKDGKRFNLPKSQLGEATKQGYKQVK